MLKWLIKFIKSKFKRQPYIFDDPEECAVCEIMRQKIEKLELLQPASSYTINELAKDAGILIEAKREQAILVMKSLIDQKQSSIKHWKHDKEKTAYIDGQILGLNKAIKILEGLKYD